MDITTQILQYLHFHPQAKRAEIATRFPEAGSARSLLRLLNEAANRGEVVVTGKGPSTVYSLSPQCQTTLPLDIDTYFLKETDEREIQRGYNFELITRILPQITIFTSEELRQLLQAQATFEQHTAQMTATEYHQEMERLGIDLSWKSAQIEGNTYSLLETERLLKEFQEAKGKTRHEALMLLNHKEALQFVVENPDYLQEISVHRIEDIHSLLMRELGVDRNIRHRRVGITGTNYAPLDNEFQIREALEDACTLINSRQSVFEKAFLTLLLLSYIQAFTDGNKRTARITANAILIANGYCPLSFRSVDSMDYKKAMLIFYEQNNISAFKKIFIDQYLFAVNTYF